MGSRIILLRSPAIRGRGTCQMSALVQHRSVPAFMQGKKPAVLLLGVQRTKNINKAFGA